MIRIPFLLAILVVASSALEVDPLLVDRAVDGPDRETAWAALRALGPEVLPELARIRDLKCRDAASAPAWAAAFDAVGQQYGCQRSLLYWYSDLAAARAAAAASGRPILSLSLLGKLTDERSCANSRLFRDLLYADPRIAALLRDRVVLHWQSERPVPQVTIDMGDGRVIRTTVCGNSIHYLLDADGRVVDAFPGLSTPDHFLALVGSAVADYAALPSDRAARAEALRRRHEREIAAANERAVAVNQGEAVPLPEVVATATAPVAAAEALTEGKFAMEWPVLKAVGLWKGGRAGADEDVRTWLVGATFGPEPAAFAPAIEAAIAARVGGSAEDQERALDDLRMRVPRDDLLDECLLRPLALRHLHEEPLQDRAAFDRWIYDALFLTPAADPWLGLLPEGYTALPHNGVVDLAGGVLSARE